MAFSDATAFPNKGQAFIVPVSFRDNTGALIKGWTGAASSISVDGAAATAGSAPVEVGSSGLGYLNLTSNQMNGGMILVECTVTNANARSSVIAIYTSDFSDDPSTMRTDRWDRVLSWLFARFYNAQRHVPIANRVAAAFKIWRRGAQETDANVFAHQELSANGINVAHTQFEEGPYS